MTTLVTRRDALTLTIAAGLLAWGGTVSARAQGSSAASFVNQFASQLVAIVNGPQPAAQKKLALGPVIDRNVDVAKVARFCLGRFWSSATPDQQAQYTTLFHQVLLNTISGHLGEYRGVTYAMRGETPQGADTLVGTVINRPNQPAVNVQWVVDTTGGSPKVVDVVAEGTSMRLTSRSDYASYLGRHGNNISALLSALHQQLGGAG